MLLVRQFPVQGTTGPANGTLAWAKPTQDYWRPMTPTNHGIFGTQEVPRCVAP